MAEIIDPVTIENPAPDPVPDPVPNPIIGFIRKRKGLKEKKMAATTLGKNAMSMAPGYVPNLNEFDEVNSQFEIDQVDNEIKGLGYDPDKAENLIGDLPDNTPDYLLMGLFDTKDPYQIKRKKAAIKWQAPVAKYIDSLPDPAQKESAKQNFDALIKARGGFEGKPYGQNISETQSAIALIKGIPGISDDDARDMLSNLRYDTEQGSVDLLLKDPEAQKRWDSLGLNPLQGVALDMDRMFGHGDRKTGQLVPGTEYEKRLLAKYTDPNALAEQNIQLADLENQGIEIVGEYLESRLRNGASKADEANKLYTESQPKLAELKAKIDSDDKIGADVKAKLATFQDEYKQAMEGTVDGVYTSPFAFEDLKAKVENNSASASEIREFNKRVERINQVAGKYNETLKEVNTLVGSQSAAVREYNKIVSNIQESTSGLQGLDNLGKWANYMAEVKNSQAKRYPQTRAIQTEEVLQDLVGANAGGVTRFVYGLANAAGGEVVNAVSKVYNNLTKTGDELRQAEMGDAFARRVEDVALNYVTKNQSLYERQVIPTISKDLQQKLDGIQADPNLSSEDKYKQSYKIIEEGFTTNKITYVANPRYGKLNLQSAAITNTIATVSSQFIGQMLMSAATGGLGNVSKARSLATLFGTTAAQVFPREYDAAVQSGQDNPFVYGLTKAIASGLSELPFDNLAFLKNLKPGSLAGKVASGLSEGQFNMLTSGKALGTIASAAGGAAEMIVKEGGLEEGLDQAFGNIVDNKFKETNKNILEGVENAMLSGIIGVAPMAVIGLPFKARTASLQNKLMIYQAGYKADKVIESINQQLGDGTLTQQEAKERIEAVTKMKKIVDGMSMYDANGKPLSDIQKAEYAWNQYVQDLAKSGLNTVPTQQQAELNTLIQEADQNNSNILNGTADATNQSTGQVGPTIGNISQPQGAVQGQQEVGQGEGLQGQTPQPQANVSYSDLSGQEVTITNVDEATGVDEVQKTVLQNSIMAAKSLLSGGISFRVFQNQADFEKAAAELGQNAKGQGAFISDGKAVLINLSKIKTPQDWGIVWHEGAHPVLNIIRNTDPELYAKMAKGFGGLAQQTDSPFAQIQAWAQADYGNKPGEVQTDEAMVETVSAIGTGAIKLQDIPTGFRQTVIDFINGIAEYLGLGQLSDTSERVFIQKANQIAQALKSGTDIAEVVGKENVGQSQNLFVQEKKDSVKVEATEKEVAQAVKMYKDVVKEQKATPEAVIAEPQRNKDGSIKFDVMVDEDGTRSIEIKYKGEPYALKNGALENVSKNEQKAIEKLSDKIVEDYKANENRPEITSAIGWYGNMRSWFQKNFGANIEMFGQLLAATSARTPVVENFKQAVDAFTNLSKGKYNQLMEDYDKHVKGIMGMTDAELETQWQSENPKKRISEFDPGDYKRMLVNRYDKVPLRSNGKKFNANSPKVLQALYGNWLEQTEGPKTKNFAGNLTGRSYAATIDVWAARYLRRIIYESKQKRWRIPPSMEKGVDFGVLKSGELSGDYPFAEAVMQKAADKLGIQADDLQAFLWYLEKDVWDKNGWSSNLGVSFEEGASTLQTDRYQAGITTFKDADTFDPVKFEEERKGLEAAIANTPGVIASRVTASTGEFYSKEGIYTEPTFDTEFTVAAGTDVTEIKKKVEQIFKDYVQDALLFSKVVDENHPNARPMIEIGLANPAEKSQIVDDVKAMLAESDVRGFTIARDSRGKILGLRAQFVPEFEDGTTMEQGVDRFTAAVEKINEKYGKDTNISYIASGFVDTEVKFKEDGKQAEQVGTTGDEVGSIPLASSQATTEPGQVPGQPGAVSTPGTEPGGPGEAGTMGEEQAPNLAQERRSPAVIAEMNSIVETAKANGTYLKAPNGKPTNLSEDQWATVRTNNFKNWFGDWENDPANASKVVDANGEPRVVFHGTNVKFDQFDKAKLGSKNWMADSAYTGFFFAGDEKTSQAYVGINNADWMGLSLTGSPILTSVVDKYKSELEAAEKAIKDVSDAEIDKERKKFEEFVAPIAQKLREEGTFGEDVIKNLLEFKRIDSEVFERINKLNEENGNNGRLNEVKNKIVKEVEKGWMKEKGLEPIILNLFLNIKNPFVFDFENAEDTEGLTSKIQDAKLNKNDGVVFKNLADGAEVDDIFVAFEPNQIKSATANTGEFSKASDKIQERISSPLIDGINDAIQERNSAAKIVSKIKDSAINRIVKLGYGYLPENVRGAMAKKTRMIDADLNEMNVISKRFEDAVKEAYGVKYKDLDDNVKQLLDSALRNFEGTVNIKEINKLKSQIPAEVLEHIDNMRLKVDIMSKRMTDLGLLDGSLEPVIDGDKGLGVYLTRSYRKYDTKDWVNKIPEDVRNRAFQFLKANNRVTEFDAAGTATERELTDEEVDGLINYIATNMDPVMEGLNAANTGRVKVDILKSRKVIPEEIRDLMGEYKDPVVNFSKTIAKMSTLITTHETLTQIRDENMGKIFFDKPTGEYFVPVAGKDAKFLQPLAGLYTTPEIADAFKEVQSTLDGEDFNMLALRALASINGFAKVGKTALSPASWVRNVIGGHIIMLKDGHLFGGKGYSKGWKSALGYFLNKSKDDAEFQSYMRELIENGIIGEGVSAGEFKAIVQAASKSDNPLEYIKNDSKLGRFVQGVKGFYSAQDDIFRIWAYENEKDRLTKRKKNMTEDEVKLEAAKKARATYPTYSELPEVVRQLAKFIPISSFPAFSAELIRTTKNSIKIGLEELADPDMRDVGAKRLAGTIAAISFGAIISGASQMIAGVDDEEEKAIKRFMPEWSRNSNLVFLGRDENDLPMYVDLGFSDPYSYFRKPFVALSGDNKLSDRFKEASREVLAPFVAPEIFLSAIIKGNKKVNESDDLDEVFGKYAGPVYEALEPGAIASARRIFKGATGEVDNFGQKYDLTLESLAFLTGQRMKSLDVPVSLGFKGRDFMKRRTELQDAYRTERSKTTPDPEKIQAELDEASGKFEEFYNEFQKDYDAALYLMTRSKPVSKARKEIDSILKDRGVPEMYRKAIKKHKPYPGINDEDKQSGEGSN